MSVLRVMTDVPHFDREDVFTMGSIYSQSGLNPDWLLWQLADSAFPTGGFAHSSGLEAAMQHGEVRNGADFEHFAAASLRQAGRSSLPFALAAYDHPDRLMELDLHFHAYTSNHVANRASRLQGKAFLNSTGRIFKLPGLDCRSWSELPHGHFAPAFGAVTRRLGVNRDASARLFLFQQLRGVVSAAVRLGIVGPMEAQSIQHRLSASAEDIAANGGALEPLDAAQTAPLAEIWQSAQDRLYSRLFQS
jgi:urease accessory protein